VNAGRIFDRTGSATAAPTRVRVSVLRAGGWLALRLALLTVIVGFGLPFLWTVSSALDRRDSTAVPWPRDLTLAHFHGLFDQLGVGSELKNSLIVSFATMLLATATASFAGYGLSRLRYRRRTWFAYGVLLLQTFPLAVTMVPIYDLSIRLRLQNTYQGLILTHTAVSLPLLVWLMKGFTDAVPRTMEEEAWVDGASEARAWWDVVVPATLPGIAVVAGFAFAYAWSEVLMVVLLVNDQAMATLPFAFFWEADRGNDAHIKAALGVLYVMPVLLIFLALRRLMIKGLVESTQGL
jgi:ABC-type glycerol-3-phosphate transport system permease component